MLKKKLYIGLLVTTFSNLVLAHPEDSQAEYILNWGETDYSQNFPSSVDTESIDIGTEHWHYRYYLETDNYTGYKDNEIYVLGSVFGGLSSVGSVDALYEMIVSQDADTDTSESKIFRFDAWADNWFSAYSGETLIVEDSVPITTERSFNAETATFTATYPIQLNILLKDYKENDTGLEYIGARNQQMGDGGFIAQITDTETNQVVAVSNANWKCNVIHEAPLNKDCENEVNPVAGVGSCTFSSSAEPNDWKNTGFDDSSWVNAFEYTEAQVSPKEGYDEMSWDENAKLIWGDDLETNNTLLCRLPIEAP